MKKLISLSVLVCLSMISCSKKEEVPDYVKNRSNKPVEETVKPETSTDFMSNKGIGPVTSVELAEAIDQEMAAKGKEIYDAKCTACHKPDEKFIGPAPKGIFSRRSPEWIMNMMLNPKEMIEKDPIAKDLVKEANGTTMVDMGLTQEEARQVLEYMRTIE